MASYIHGALQTDATTAERADPGDSEDGIFLHLYV